MIKKFGLHLIAVFLLLPLLFGCGFHLRGSYPIPPSFQVLKIKPTRYDIFQRALRQLLKNNRIQVVEQNAQTPEAVTLMLLDEFFSERVIAYGSDGQPNRALLSLKIIYQLLDTQGKIMASDTAEVSRELTLNPNAILGTENERNRLKGDLYLDAGSQLVRQLAALPYGK